jgi:hypothetical protein
VEEVYRTRGRLESVLPLGLWGMKAPVNCWDPSDRAVRGLALEIEGLATDRAREIVSKQVRFPPRDQALAGVPA